MARKLRFSSPEPHPMHTQMLVVALLLSSFSGEEILIGRKAIQLIWREVPGNVSHTR